VFDFGLFHLCPQKGRKAEGSQCLHLEQCGRKAAAALLLAIWMANQKYRGKYQDEENKWS